MIKTEIDKMLEDAKAAKEDWPNGVHVETYDWPRVANHIANCSPEKIKWMGERLRELEGILQDIWDEADPDTIRERIRVALKLC